IAGGDSAEIPPFAEAGRLTSGADAPARTAGNHQEVVGAVQPEQVRRSGVPGILADQHSEAAERCGHSSQAVSGGKLASLIEHSVGRQVDLSMVVENFPSEQEEYAVVEAVILRLFDPPHHQSDAAGAGPPARGLC